jgi:hypothetical protein
VIALSSATFSSMAYVTVRQLAKTEHPLVIVFYFPLVATRLAIPTRFMRTFSSASHRALP